jgi:23S rRNA pseudouridine2604 synthase
MNINEFLGKQFKLSGEECVLFMQENEVVINGEPAIQRQAIRRSDGITINGKELRASYEFVYYAFYKPRGIECTMNVEIESNLLSVLTVDEYVFPIGRLDKESEGLLLLTNDGSLYKNIALADSYKEKEYEVEVDKEIGLVDLKQLSDGVKIKGQFTRPALVRALSATSFNIVLTQGINRQIRRMCYKLGYEVTSLKRIRVAKVELGDLNVGELMRIKKSDII